MNECGFEILPRYYNISAIYSLVFIKTISKGVPYLEIYSKSSTYI